MGALENTCMIGEEQKMTCVYCGLGDDVEHTLFLCPKWITIRNRYTEESGVIFNEANMVKDLMASEERWRYTYKAIRSIIGAKEKDEH